jgi:hypothetical protein
MGFNNRSRAETMLFAKLLATLMSLALRETHGFGSGRSRHYVGKGT